MFLVFEGIDGCGKSTQAKLLEAHIRDRLRKQVLLVREPGGTPLGESVRSLLLTSTENLAPETELFLFMAARSHLARTRIAPALAAGRVVISDRFVLSSAVYQGVVVGQDPRVVYRMARLAAPGLKVSRTLLIDIEPETAFRRVKDPNRMEAKGLDFQRRVRKGFLALAKRPDAGVAVIDGRGSADEVHRRVLKALPSRGWSACSSR